MASSDDDRVCAAEPLNPLAVQWVLIQPNRPSVETWVSEVAAALGSRAADATRLALSSDCNPDDNIGDTDVRVFDWVCALNSRDAPATPERAAGTPSAPGSLDAGVRPRTAPARPHANEIGFSIKQLRESQPRKPYAVVEVDKTKLMEYATSTRTNTLMGPTRDGAKKLSAATEALFKPFAAPMHGPDSVRPPAFVGQLRMDAAVSVDDQLTPWGFMQLSTIHRKLVRYPDLKKGVTPAMLDQLGEATALCMLATSEFTRLTRLRDVVERARRLGEDASGVCTPEPGVGDGIMACVRDFETQASVVFAKRMASKDSVLAFVVPVIMFTISMYEDGYSVDDALIRGTYIASSVYGTVEDNIALHALLPRTHTRCGRPDVGRVGELAVPLFSPDEHLALAKMSLEDLIEWMSEPDFERTVASFRARVTAHAAKYATRVGDLMGTSLTELVAGDGCYVGSSRCADDVGRTAAQMLYGFSSNTYSMWHMLARHLARTPVWDALLSPKTGHEIIADAAAAWMPAAIPLPWPDVFIQDIVQPVDADDQSVYLDKSYINAARVAFARAVAVLITRNALRCGSEGPYDELVARVLRVVLGHGAKDQSHHVSDALARVLCTPWGHGPSGFSSRAVSDHPVDAHYLAVAIGNMAGFLKQTERAAAV